jgi:hypothetical protein
MTEKGKHFISEASYAGTRRARYDRAANLCRRVLLDAGAANGLPANELVWGISSVATRSLLENMTRDEAGEYLRLLLDEAAEEMRRRNS